MFTNAPSTSSTPVFPSATLEQHLTKLSRDMVLACNSHHWDPESYPWTHLSQNFMAGPTFATLPTSMDVSAFLQGFRTVYESNPDYYTRTMSVSVYLGDKSEEAEVFANFQNVNYTPGVIRYSVGHLRFQKEKESGKWMCVYYGSLPGPNG